MKREWELEELIECWTLDPEEVVLLANKTGATRLGFALMLKFFELEARFPRREDVPRPAVEFMAGQVKVDAELFAAYDWSGRTIKNHRAQVRDRGTAAARTAAASAREAAGHPACTERAFDSALDQAREAAGDRDVRIAGGAETIQEYLDSGLIDEFSINLAPVLLGTGIRLFDRVDPDRLALDQARTDASSRVTHLTYTVGKR